MEEESLSRSLTSLTILKIKKNKSQETRPEIELSENIFTTAYNRAAFPNGGRKLVTSVSLMGSI